MKKVSPIAILIKRACLQKIKKPLEELSRNHNHSWAVEIFLRNQDNLDAIAMNYRGHKKLRMVRCSLMHMIMQNH